MSFIVSAMLQSKQITLRSAPSARLSAQNSASRVLHRSPVMLVCNAAQSQASPSSRLAPAPFNDVEKRVLPLLSELVEIQALTTAFEQAAGRSAMIGFALAFSAELFLPQNATVGIFGGVCSDSVGNFAFLVAGLVACSVALAYASPMKLGRTLLEPILASLTSQSRSAGALTDRNVDGALDAALDAVFNQKFVRQVFPIDFQSDSLTILQGIDEDDDDDEDIPLYFLNRK